MILGRRRGGTHGHAWPANGEAADERRETTWRQGYRRDIALLIEYISISIKDKGTGRREGMVKGRSDGVPRRHGEDRAIPRNMPGGMLWKAALTRLYAQSVVDGGCGGHWRGIWAVVVAERLT